MRTRCRLVSTFAVLALAASLAPVAADPMKPLGEPAPSSLALPAETVASAPAAQADAARFSATRSDAAGRWEALIGTRWLRRGDRLGEARVLEIDANRVLLVRDGRRETLYLLAPLTPAHPTARAAAPHAAAAASAPPF